MTQPLADNPCVPEARGEEVVVQRSWISAYTPSNMDRETRERIFVQRHQMLSQAVRWCEESMLTGDKHHVLYIGPRGCGKTHLVSMIHDHVSANPRLADKMRIAWLGEDTVFTGLIDLALEIADELSKAYPEEFAFEYREGARGLSPDEAAEQILGEVVNRLGNRSILLIMENLDRAMRGLGDLGQKKWRAFLQEQSRVATIATSQQLFDDVSNRSAPFYGFFEIIHLDPLSVENARELMAKIAREGNKPDLAKFLATAEGRYRVRALHHLAGGNHRMYVLLSEFLTKESLDGLVACFEELADELTPYFQERIRSLSPQQARIVQTLCNAEGAMTVKKVAEETFIPERNVSKQLGELKQKGYVGSEKRGKESYYDMAEPLMRLCLEVKKQRGEPLRLVAGFLRVWCAKEVLKNHGSESNVDLLHGMRSRQYAIAALELNDAFRFPIDQELMREFSSNLSCGNLDAAAGNADELICADRQAGLFARGAVSLERGDFEGAIADYSTALEQGTTHAYLESVMLWMRARAYGELGKHDKAITDCSHIFAMDGAMAGERTRALILRAMSYLELGKNDRAIHDYSAVAAMEGVKPDERALALCGRAIIYSRSRESEQAIRDLSAVSEMPGLSQGKRTFVLFTLPVLIARTGSADETLSGLVHAFEYGDRNSNEYGGQPDDVLRSILRREYQSWSEFVERLIPVYAEYNALDKLGNGLTESIAAFDEGEYSEVQLDMWNSSWQHFGRKYEELSIPMQTLDAAIRTIKGGNDRPLFDLPLEIRKLVRPLLKKTLSGK